MKFIKVMNYRGSSFELYLEILTQVKNGNNHYYDLIKCTNLPEHDLNQIMEPLILIGLLKKVESVKDRDNEILYLVTERGELFIDNLEMVLRDIELD